MRKTKIVCTLGPAVDTDEKIRDLIKAGMNCARLNFSHGTHEEQKVRMERVRRVSAELGVNIPILLDTKGPEIRLRDFVNGSVMIKAGQTFTFCKDYNEMGDENHIGLTYPNLGANVTPGTRILVDDGKVGFDVVEVKDGNVICQAVNDGKLSNHKSINVPNVMIDMPYINDVDRSDILFGIKENVDFIAASFVRNGDDLKELHKLLDENGGFGIKIISKIENRSGVDAMDEIIELSDGVMVARGDLGVEIPFVELPPIQKEMISKCKRQKRIVITATQMLDSMIKNPRPTRAEVSDVANAIYDGTTAIMLSGESAAGDYPIESCATMASIAKETEKNINYRKRFHDERHEVVNDSLYAISRAAAGAAINAQAKAIVSVSRTGRTIDALSAQHPTCPIIAAILDPRALRQACLQWNVYPVAAEEKFTTDDLFASAKNWAKQTGLVSDGDTVIITASSAISPEAGTNVMTIATI